MISAPTHTPGTAADTIELTRLSRRRARMRRHRENIRFAVVVLILVAAPASIPAVAFRKPPALVATPPAKAPISVLEPAYSGTPAELPEGLNTLHIRRIR